MSKAANIRPTSSLSWHNQVGGALALSVVFLGLAYLMLSRAIFTGSLQQYVMTFVLVILAGNRAATGFKNRQGK
ncbi:MAG TPA: hypothetical protein VFI74_02855 [Candidatus Saccharimonadales bacterium]|nr:hypothetical protein [Candidatus Saccharimonadales bacterium]